MNHNLVPGNRNSTPETSSSLRPPSQRSNMTSNHHLRSSADMGGMSAVNSSASRDIRPASEVLYNQHHRGASHGGNRDTMDQAAQQWIADIDSCETTLEEMAAATLDQDFKDELSAIEQWFRVLSEAERTAALYALLQQTTQVQIRFFIGVLQQMAKSHPYSAVMSPSSYGDKDPMTARLSTAMNKLNIDPSRNSLGPGARVPPSPGVKRNSGLNQDEISKMFPEAAAAIAQQKSDFTNHTGAAPTSNRNSTALGDRSSFAAPTITASLDEQRRDQLTSQLSPSPWGNSRGTENSSARPKSSSGQQPMGQFSQPMSTQSRSPRPAPLNQDINQQLMNPTDSNGMPLLSPYTAGGNWASMVNTPMVPNFNQNNSQADMIANATAMKLAAMSTAQGRVQLDDARKNRRARSTEGHGQPPLSAGLGSPAGFQNFPMTDQLGQMLSPQQAAALQAQQLAALQGRRSRPNSPGLTVPGQGLSDMNFAGTQQNGFLSAYNSNHLGGGLGNLSLGAFGGMGGNEGYLSDASEIARGRSPRGRRGTSRPPEDPTDLQLLNDIPAWLRSLRLHKYTDNLKMMKWQDLVQLDDKGLEDRGVAAVGARRKMLKVFEEVREAQAQGKI